MKELKFRARDKDGHWVYSDKCGLDLFFALVLAHKLDPLQYIGLKDSKGVEIYEGDRARLAGLNGIIIWDDAIASFRLKSDGRQTVTHQTVSKMIKAQIEVIGNIYEGAN